MSARYAVAARDAVVALFPTGDSAAASGGRLNVLLLGVDAGPGRDGAGPTASVVSVDVRSGRPLLISLPRNLQKGNIPRRVGSGGQVSGRLLRRGRSIRVASTPHGPTGSEPGSLPRSGRPGVTAVEQAVEGTLGLPMHYHVIIDLQGFRDLVDALGGVTIRITEEIPIGQDGRVLQPGLRRLDGYETLWYARSRAASSDYARMSRQRCVLGAILHEADPATVLRNFTSLAAASTSVVSTNIPQDQLPDLVDMALTAKDLPITTSQLVPPLIDPADPDPSAIDEQLELARRPSTNPTSVGVAAGDATRGGGAAAEEQPEATGEAAEPSQSSADSTNAAAPAAVDLSSVCAYE